MAKKTISDANLVSIVIPTYNNANYLTEGIDSVLNQTYKNYEIIVVDDGSTDQTKDLLLSYKENIRYIYQKNGGPAKARNTGIKAANGDYIAFLDSDDLWLPDRLQTGVDFLNIHHKIDFVFSDCMVIDDNGIISESLLKKKKSYCKLLDERNELMDPLQLNLKGSFSPTSSVLIRKNILDKTGLFDEKMPPGEDQDLWIRIAMFGKMAFIPRSLSKYRLHPNNISKNQERMMKVAIYSYNKLYKNYPRILHKYSKEINETLARKYFSLGYIYFSKNRMKDARMNLKESLIRKMITKTIIYYFLSYIPTFIIDILRETKAILISKSNDKSPKWT